MGIDVYRANRQLERFFGYKGPSHFMERQKNRLEELGEKVELIATIFYDNKNQTVETIRSDQSKEKK